MFDIDSFFAKHGSKILTFDVKVGAQVTRLDFSRDFVLGADRTNPFALQQRCDEGSSKAATYGTLLVAARFDFKTAQRDFKAWYARIHKATRAKMIASINTSGLAYNLKKGPTSEDVEHELITGEYGKELRERQDALDALEKTTEQMEVLYTAAKLDAEIARSMSSMGKAMLEREMIGQGHPRQQAPSDQKKPHNPDADF